MKPFKIEYIWLDGSKPVQNIRSKTQIIYLSDRQESVELSDIPPSYFDGSCTGAEIESGFSELLLIPAHISPDPQRSDGIIALCEVFKADGTVPASNSRRRLNSLWSDSSIHQPTIGFDQQYLILKDGIPLNWKSSKINKSRSEYYCGVGADNCLGRDFAEDHLNLCLSAKIPITSLLAENSVAKWSFKIDHPNTGVVAAADNLIVARFLLQRLGEKYGYDISFDQNPFGSRYDQSLMVSRFSTKQMRDEKGIEYIRKYYNYISSSSVIKESSSFYNRAYDNGFLNNVELFSDFDFANNKILKIPFPVLISGRGYIEDRSPLADSDPYSVSCFLLDSLLKSEIKESSK